MPWRQLDSAMIHRRRRPGLLRPHRLRVWHQRAAAGWAVLGRGDSRIDYSGMALGTDAAHASRITRPDASCRYTEVMPESFAPAASPATPLPGTIRMVAIDMDGTLLPDFSTVVSRRNREALRAAQLAGIRIVIATGRRQAFTAPLLEGVGLDPETPLVTSNGAVTRTFRGDRLDFRHLRPELARALAGLLRGTGMTVFTLDRAEPPDLIVEDMAIARGRLAKWVEANRGSIRAVRPIESALGDEVEIIQGMAAGTLQEMAEADRRLSDCTWKDEFAGIRTAYPGHDLSILDLLPPGVSKRSALERLAAQWRIAPEDVMTIGDNWNDEAMLDWAGTGVLMGNATDELLQLAPQRGWRIAPRNTDDGVAAMLELAIASRNHTAK